MLRLWRVRVRKDILNYEISNLLDGIWFENCLFGVMYYFLFCYFPEFMTIISGSTVLIPKLINCRFREEAWYLAFLYSFIFSLSAGCFVSLYIAVVDTFHLLNFYRWLVKPLPSSNSKNNYLSFSLYKIVTGLIVMTCYC